MITHIRALEITNDDERVARCQAMNAEEWRGPLTVEQHILREELLENNFVSNGLRMRHWALELHTPQGWEIVCSLDSLERPAFVKVKGFKALRTVNHVIDAVFTPRQHRGQGYAKTLVDYVCKQLETLSTSDDVTAFALSKSLITLWSDIGDYYRQFGFDGVSAMQIAAPYTDCARWPKAVIALDAQDSRSQISQVCAAMLESISIKTELDGVTRAIVAPTSEVLEQMQIRAEYVSSCLNIEAPEVYGARTANGWVAWTYQMAEQCVYILGIFGPMAEMALLFQAAQAAAAKYGFGVVMYEGDLVHVDRPVTSMFLYELDMAGVSYDYSARKDSLPFYLRSGTRSDVLLEYPGKYSWF